MEFSRTISVSVEATDNQTYSQTTELIIMIDAINVGGIGYFTDDDGDGTYDMFHSDSDDVKTVLGLSDEGQYLIDSNGDDKWEYVYDLSTDVLVEYSAEEPEPGITEEIPWQVAVLIVIALTIIALIVYLYKKN